MDVLIWVKNSIFPSLLPLQIFFFYYDISSQILAKRIEHPHVALDEYFGQKGGENVLSKVRYYFIMENREYKDLDEVIFREQEEELEERVKYLWREIRKTQELMKEVVNLMHDVKVQISNFKANMGQVHLIPYVIPRYLLYHGDAI